MFTVSGSSVRRCAIGLGIVGYIARTGESVLTELIMDSRFDENIDKHCMETDSFAQTEKHIIPGRTRGDSFSVTQYGLLGSTSPLLLGIAVRNCEGVVIGVLTATRMPDASAAPKITLTWPLVTSPSAAPKDTLAWPLVTSPSASPKDTLAWPLVTTREPIPEHSTCLEGLKCVLWVQEWALLGGREGTKLQIR